MNTGASGRPANVAYMLELLLALGAVVLAGRWLAAAAAALGIPSVAVATISALL